MRLCLPPLLALVFSAFLGYDCTTHHVPAKHWSYHGKLGPVYWCSLFSQENQQCCGKRQSPIDINTKKVVFTDHRLDITNLDFFWSTTTLSNNGHTVMIMLNGSAFNLPQLTLLKHSEDGGERSISPMYNLDHLHFHFGMFSDRGAEHTINGKVYPMEMHMVFYQTKYNSFDNAKMHPKGLVVVAVHFEISTKGNKLLQPLIKRLPKIAFQMVQTTMPDVSLRDFLPKEINKYYSYEGSMTTPLCNEVVTWYILKQRVPISEIQMARYRQLTKQGLSAKIIEGHQHHNNGHNYLFDNFRPLQPLNGRLVTENNPDLRRQDVTEPTVELHITQPHTCTRWRCYPFGINFPHVHNAV